MACCGSSRLRASGTAGAGVRGTPAQRPVEFEYRGHSTLRATGPATGRDYWFARPGARVWVDGRDAPSFEGIPNLTRTTS